MNIKSNALFLLVVLGALLALPTTVASQEAVRILQGPELTRVVPPGFYFKGLSAPTQTRNSVAVRNGDRYVVAGLVDTSGYAADVRAKFEGFFITDSAITVGGSDVATGAYGFGFTNDGKLNLLDLAGNEVLSVSTTKDTALRRPRPLMLMKSTDEIRLYNGRNYVVIAFK
jgi:hypothetical protein